MKSNFEFLRRYWPALAEIGATAEGYLFTDPNSCIFKLGMFGERVVSEIFAVEHLRTPEADDSQAARIRILKREGLLPSNIDDIFYTLRQQRNKAVHAGLDSLADAKTLLEMTYRLACWFMEVYVVNGLNQFMKGDNSPSISKDDLENWLYPIPPIAEQKRIVIHVQKVLEQIGLVTSSLS